MPRLDIAAPLTSHLNLIAYAAYNLPLSDDANSFFWGGVGLKLAF